MLKHGKIDPDRVGSPDVFQDIGNEGESADIFAQTLIHAVRKTGRPIPVVIPAQAVTLATAVIPVRGVSAKRAALPFALEDAISASLDDVHIAFCRLSAPPDTVLAAIVDTRMMASLGGAPDAQVLPETFALPAPDPDADAPVWAVWHAGGRVLVRVSDGSGFCLNAAMFAAIWQQAGRPAINAYGDALPAAIPVAMHSRVPPPPAGADLAVDLRQGDFASASGDWSSHIWKVAAVICFGLFAHLAISAVDAMSLARIAASEREVAQTAIAPMLPGVQISSDVQPILQRLAPPPPAPPGSAFVPLLADMSQLLIDAGVQIEIRRLTFSDDPARLRIVIEVPTVEDLQQAERVLLTGGLQVESGAVTASAGVATAEFAIAKQGEI